MLRSVSKWRNEKRKGDGRRLDIELLWRMKEVATYPERLDLCCF